VQVADLSHENFKSSRVMRWWLSRLSSRFGAKSSHERKPKWLPGLYQYHDALRCSHFMQFHQKFVQSRPFSCFPRNTVI